MRHENLRCLFYRHRNSAVGRRLAYAHGAEFRFPLLHACSLYYFILGSINVCFYDHIRFDVAYRAVRDVLDIFNRDSKWGFITGRDRSGINYPLLDISIWIAGILAYCGIRSLFA